MNRLKKNNSVENFLGKIVEIIRINSKYNGYRGLISDSLVNGKFKILLPPATYEQREEKHVLYIKEQDIYKWVRVIH